MIRPCGLDLIAFPVCFCRLEIDRESIEKVSTGIISIFSGSRARPDPHLGRTCCMSMFFFSTTFVFCCVGVFFLAAIDRWGPVARRRPPSLGRSNNLSTRFHSQRFFLSFLSDVPWFVPDCKGCFCSNDFLSEYFQKNNGLDYYEPLVGMIDILMGSSWKKYIISSFLRLQE